MSIEFLITCFFVAITPGTGLIYTLVTALSRGSTGGLLAAFGSTLSILPHIGAAVFGLAAIMHTSALAFQTLKIVGVIYLLFMAWRVLNDAQSFDIRSKADSRSHRAVISQGILLGVFNPKLSVFFLAFLPQFVSVDGANPIDQMLLLGAVFMLITFLVFALLGFAAGAVRRSIASKPGILIWLRRTFATTFVALGARLAFAER